MRLHEIPSLVGINGGEELRAHALRIQNLCEVVGKYKTGTPELVAAFWKDQLARLKDESGHPSDGLFLGYGVPEIRLYCYKVLSDIRMHRKNTEKGAAWEMFCDFLATAALAGGGQPPVDDTVIVLGKSAINMVKAGNTAAALAQTYKQGYNPFTATVNVSVTPVGADVSVEAVGCTAALADGVLTVTAPAEDGTVTLKGKTGKPAVLNVTVYDRGVGTESMAAATIGTPFDLAADFVSPHPEGEHTEEFFSSDVTTATVAGRTVTPLNTKGCKIAGVIAYADSPDLFYADHSQLNISEPAARTVRKVAVKKEV